MGSGLVKSVLLLAALVGFGGFVLVANRAVGVSPPVIEVQGSDGTFAFTPAARGDGVPCLNYITSNGAGVHCFVAVGHKGGWALEAESVTSSHDVVFYGATIRAAARVRIGKVASLPTGPYSKRFHVRFFAGLVPRKALRVRPNSIVALDRRGRLLGRQHYNDGSGGFGRCDGSWDRKHCR